MPRASVVLATRNRQGELRQAIASALAQSVPVEVIVLDDGSDDGTPEMVRHDFPGVRYRRFESPRGPATLRTLGAEMARCEILFPIDDDSIFASPRTIEQTLSEFDHPRVAVVAIPFVNVRQGSEVHQRGPDDGEIVVTQAFVGASHAMRRSVFLGVGGYRRSFFYMGEEGELCDRLLNAGYVARLGRADPIQHLESPRRTPGRQSYLGRRNDILGAWYNAPWSALPLHLIATTWNGIRFGFRFGMPWLMLRGLLLGYWQAMREWQRRDPIQSEVYWVSRRLRKTGPRPLAEIEAKLPPPRRFDDVAPPA